MLMLIDIASTVTDIEYYSKLTNNYLFSKYR